jgi:hypothetical protein
MKGGGLTGMNKQVKKTTNYYHANNAVASSILYLAMGIKQMVYARLLRPKLSLLKFLVIRMQ